MELKVVCCPLTGAMLHAELQRGKELMKNKYLYKELGATAACTVHLANMSSNCGRSWPLDKEIFVGDSWFSSAKVVIELQKCNYHYIGQVKTNHANFPKAWLEEYMEDMAPGHWMLLHAKVDLDGDNMAKKKRVEIVAVGYKYNKTKVNCFVMDYASGSHQPGPYYCARYWEEDGKCTTKWIARPWCIDDYYSNIGAVDNHNRVRQGHLRMEKT